MPGCDHGETVQVTGSASEAGPQQVFAGRERELTLIRAALAAARAGQPRIVIVEGEAGMGKSALLRRVLAEAGPDVVLSASGEEGEDRLTWGILAQLRASAGAELAPCFGRLAADPPAGADPLMVGAGLLDALGSMQAGGTIVIALDDAHWADPPSVAALVFACRRLVADQVLVLATLRPVETHRLGEPWRRLADGERAVRLRLEGLAVSETAQLATRLGQPLSAFGARRLWEHTQGHPLYVRALLDELGSEVISRASGPLPAPHSLAAVVLARLARCSSAAQRLATAASVLGQRAPVAQAVRLAGIAEPVEALSEVVAAGLMVETAGSWGQDLAFGHPLIRAAVYDDLGLAQRRTLHASAAELAGGQAGLEHRLAAAAGPDEVLASELEAAAVEAARGQLGQAGHHLHQAATLSEPGPDRERRVLDGVEAYLGLSDVAAAEVVRGDLEALPVSPRRSYLAGNIAYLANRAVEARAHFADAWERLGPTRAPAALAAAIAAHLCVLSIVWQQEPEGVSWGEIAWATGAAEPLVAGLTFFARSVALAVAGRAAEALAPLLDLGPAEVAPIPMLHALVGRGMIRLWTDDLAGAAEDFTAVLARAGAGQPLRFVSQATGYLGEVYYRLGELDQAVVQTELACARSMEAGRVFDLAYVHSMAVYPRAARGDMAEARAHVRAAQEAATASGVVGSVAYAAAGEAALAQASGDVEALAQAASRHRPSTELGVFLGPIQAEALLGLGREKEAEASLEDWEAQATRLGRRSALLSAARLRVELETARGAYDAARAAFEAGLDQAAGLQMPLELARLRLAFGVSRARAGDRRTARQELTTAAETFATLGARPYLARAEAALGGLGAVRQRGAAVASLSAQESVVASLVASGLGNQAVADRLVLSVKTVEYHLTNIYARLGLSSRSQLVAYLARSGGG